MSSYIIPVFILLVIFIGIIERKDIYELFIEGVIKGLKTVYSIFPYIFAITIISGLLRDTGILNMFSFGEILPLIIMKPLSGGASTAIVLDIFKNNGVDSFFGLFSSIIMASTETTLYVISIMSSKIKIKNMKIPIICGLIGDFTAIILGLIITKIMI